MTTFTLRRWGAVLLTGGLMMTVAYSFFPASAHSSRLLPAAALALVGVLLVLPALVAFQRGQSGAARVHGWIGTTMLCMALALLEIPHLLFGVFSRSSLYDVDAYHAGLWGQLAFGGLILLGPALIVLAVAVMRSGAYPRWTAPLIIANVVVSASVGFVTPLGNALHSPAPSYLLMSLIGVAMIRLARVRGERSAESVTHVGRATPATSAAL